MSQDGRSGEAWERRHVVMLVLGRVCVCQVETIIPHFSDYHLCHNSSVREPVPLTTQRVWQGRDEEMREGVGPVGETQSVYFKPNHGWCRLALALVCRRLRPLC